VVVRVEVAEAKVVVPVIAAEGVVMVVEQPMEVAEATEEQVTAVAQEVKWTALLHHAFNRQATVIKAAQLVNPGSAQELKLPLHIIKMLNNFLFCLLPFF
jgi:hypothetical protein